MTTQPIAFSNQTLQPGTTTFVPIIIPPSVLSVNQLFLSIAKNTPNFESIQKAKKLLGKGQLIYVFSESDRVHLMQIMLNFSSPIKIEEAKAIIECFKVVKENLGEEIFFLISQSQSYKGASHSSAARLLLQLIEGFSYMDLIFPLLVQFSEQKIKILELLERIEIIKEEAERKKFPEKNIEEVMKAFADTGPGSLVAFPLNSKELTLLKDQYLKIKDMGKTLKKQGIDQMITFVKEFQIRQAANSIKPDDKLMLIAIAREVIKIKFGIYAYNTQILTILGLLQFPSNTKGRIAQVRTGEGKSLIVTILTFLFAVQGNPVDVISSNRYLAVRDQVRYAEKFFNLFGIQTSHICEDLLTEENFKGLVIYGTNNDFEFTLMRDFLGQEDVRRLKQGNNYIPRPRKITIVDEVDNLFIDEALNTSRMSIEGRIDFNWINQPIHDFVESNKEHAKIFKALSLLPKQQQIQDAQTAFIQSLRTQLLDYQSGKFKPIIETIKDKNLETWISSAYDALYMYKINQDYVVKPVKTYTAKGPVYKDKVVIVDKDNTGRLQESQRWERRVHEFVEVKEKLTPEEEDLMPASISHPLYFRDYDLVFGLTGTMGVDTDREEIQKTYCVDTFDVPPHKLNKRDHLSPKILFSVEDHRKVILEEIQEIQSKKRPVLVFFETIQETEEFHVFLKNKKIYSQVLNERQAENEDVVIIKAGSPGMVTIATNTAGRGTDIILYPRSLENGGLHVIGTFYPENDRVETQMVGRAARQGQPGSCRLILYFKHSSITSPEEALNFLKKKREEKTNKLSKHREQRLLLEEINHKYLNNFVCLIQTWQKTITDQFLEELNTKMIKKIGETSSFQPPKQALEKVALKLQNTFRYQITYKDTFKGSWVPFLKSVRHALSTRIQQDWAEFFYSKLDDLQEKVKSSFSSHQCPNEELKKQYSDTLVKQFKKHSPKWENYLTDPRQGFYNYLAIITGFYFHK